MNYSVIKIEGFSVLHVLTEPERVESKVVFDRNDISQKLIFTLMNICHDYGFGCSAPKFNGPDDSIMTFYVGTFLPTKNSLNKFTKKLSECLSAINEFAKSFNQQLKFDNLDLTMFHGVDLYSFSPEQLAAIRDQHFNGSWALFKKSLVSENKDEEADIVERCKQFEKLNKKDIGLVGHKLSYIMELLQDNSSNTVFN